MNTLSRVHPTHVFGRCTTDLPFSSRIPTPQRRCASLSLSLSICSNGYSVNRLTPGTAPGGVHLSFCSNGSKIQHRSIQSRWVTILICIFIVRCFRLGSASSRFSSSIEAIHYVCTSPPPSQRHSTIPSTMPTWPLFYTHTPDVATLVLPSVYISIPIP